MNEPAKKAATYDDLEQVPDRFLAQIIDGELIVLPRPGARHQRASSILGSGLGGPFDLGSGGPGGWWILDAPELHLGRDILVPDLAGWRRERMPVVPDAAYFELAPDWICEVLSPSTAGIDRIRKLDIYARERVSFAWLIDPRARTLEVFRRDGATWVRVAAHEGDVSVRAEPFDAVPLDLAPLWSGFAPTPPDAV